METQSSALEVTRAGPFPWLAARISTKTVDAVEPPTIACQPASTAVQSKGLKSKKCLCKHQYQTPRFRFPPQTSQDVVSTPGRPTGPDSMKTDGHGDPRVRGQSLLILFGNVSLFLSRSGPDHGRTGF